MLRFEVRWRNFRGFEDTGWIEIRPITVLIGANSTGKSSLLAPLLLLKQTLRSRTRTVPLVSRGDLANVGSFRDFVIDHDLERQVSFYVRWHSHTPKGEEGPVGEYPPGELRVSFAASGPDLVLARYEVRDTYGRVYLTRQRLRSGRYSLRKLPSTGDRGETHLQRVADNAALAERPDHFLFEGDVVLNAQIARRGRGASRAHEHDESEPRLGLHLSPFSLHYWSVVATTAHAVRSLLRETSYLGPLREPLRRVYEVSGDPPRDVGTRGEMAPEVLFRSPDLLSDAQQWLRRFGLERPVRISPTRDDAFSMLLPAGGRRPSVNLADAGFGASQVLPLIVQGLHGEPGSLLVTEQPEIHLNPRLQSRIAEFFGFLAGAGKGVLVETHSEHLLLRLRTLMAKDEVSDKDVALYFVERDTNRARLRRIPINGDGRIEPRDWPSGFFQDSAREGFALAAEQGRSQPNAR